MMFIVSYSYLLIFLLIPGSGIIKSPDSHFEKVPQDEVLSRLDSLFRSQDSHDTPGCAGEDSKEGRLALSWVYGMPDRGLLYSGTAAGNVIFNIEAVQERATFDDPHQLSEGMAGLQ